MNKKWIAQDVEDSRFILLVEGREMAAHAFLWGHAMMSTFEKSYKLECTRLGKYKSVLPWEFMK